MAGCHRGIRSPRARFVRLGAAGGPQPTILLADDPRPERRHWAVAHEIGEHQAHLVFDHLGLSPADAEPAAREAVANRLAGCLLLPRDWFLADGADCAWDLFELKARYATASHEMVARRMLEMPPPAIITLFDHDRPQWRRSNVPGRTPPLSPAERDARQAAHDCGEPTWCEASELPDGIDDVRAGPSTNPTGNAKSSAPNLSASTISNSPRRAAGSSPRSDNTKSNLHRHDLP